MQNRELFRLKYSTSMIAGSNEAEIMIYGEIIQDMPENWKWSREDKSAADFDKAVKAVINDGATKLKLRINSPGGILTEAMAMRAILMDAGFEEIDIHIQGLCASAATVIAAMPGAHVAIYEGSEFMIHNPWTRAWGEASDLEHAAQHLRGEEATVRSIYAARCGQSDDQIREWMDAETWMSAQQAVDYGFADELIAAPKQQASAACVTQRTMSVMRGMYRNVPEMECATDEVSNGGAAETAGPTENIRQEERENMEIRDITREQLQAENAELHDSLMRAGAEAERARMQEIDELTPPGYEAMADEAKASGMSAMDYHKQLVKAQRERAGQHMAQRTAETSAAAQVSGGGAEETGGADETAKMDAFAKEMAGYAKDARAAMDGGMY